MHINDVMMRGMLSELEQIKTAGLGSFVTKGVEKLRSIPKQGLGVHWGKMKNIYHAGSTAVNKDGVARGMMGGAKKLWRSPYGAAAGTLGLGGLAGYGAYKAF